MDTIEVNTQSTDNRPPNWTPSIEDIMATLNYMAAQQEAAAKTAPPTAQPVVQPAIVQPIQIVQPTAQPTANRGRTVGAVLIVLGILGLPWLPLSVPTILLGMKIVKYCASGCCSSTKFITTIAWITFVLFLGVGIGMYVGLFEFLFETLSGTTMTERDHKFAHDYISSLCMGVDFINYRDYQMHCNLYFFMKNGFGAVLIAYAIAIAFPIAILSCVESDRPKERPIVAESVDAANVV